MKLLVLDGNSILNRAFYGIKILTTKDGIYTNGIYGFLVMLDKLNKEINPDGVAVAFDVRAQTFRHKAFRGYKAGRKGMPSELISQLPILKELLLNLGYKIVECEGFEADDILGTLALACEETDNECVIATGDKDALQLVSKKVVVRIASTKCGRPCVVLYDLNQIKKEFGLSPKQLVDVKALKGDTSDNIPGVVGIGIKNAIALISKFETLENLYKDTNLKNLKDGVKKKLIEGENSAKMSYMLGKIRTDVPIDKSLENYLPRKMNYEKVKEMMIKLELFSLLKKIKNPEDSDEKKKENIPLYPEVICEEDFEKLFKILKEKKEANFVVSYVNKKIKNVAFIVENSIICVKNDGHKFSKFLKTLLEDALIKKCTYNCKNLFLYCEKQKIKIENVNFDVFLAAYLLNPASKNYRLEDLALEYGENFQLDEKFLSDFLEIDNNLVGQAILFFKIYKKIISKIEKFSQNSLLKEIEIPIARVLGSMEISGVKVNKEGILKYKEVIEAKIKDLEENIYKMAGVSFNIQSSKQLGKVLFEDFELPHEKQGVRGYSTNYEVLKRLRFMHPIVDNIMKFRTLTKIKSVYCDALLKNLKKDNKIHTIFKQTETRTGRLSSVEPNLQNIPIKTSIGRELRKFFCSEEGYMLVNADYSQVELRVLAHVSEDKKMIEAFEANQDIHVTTASEVFNMPPNMITKSMRQHAKVVNFGIVYGMSAFSLSKDIGITVKEAGDYILKYFDHYSGIKKYFEKVLKFGRKNGYVETIFGRRRYLPELSSSNHNLRLFGERVAMNMPIQGSAADIIKIAMINVYKRLKKKSLDASIILQVHDELIIEAKEDQALLVSKILEEEMTTCVNLKVDLKAKASVGKTWYDTKLCKV